MSQFKENLMGAKRLFVSAIAVLVLGSVGAVPAHAEWPVSFGEVEDLTSDSNELFSVKDIAADRNGNTYVAANFKGKILLPNTDGSAEELRSQGSLDFLVAKYDPSGELDWVINAGSSGLDTINTLAISYDDAATGAVRIHIGGAVGGRINMGGSVVNLFGNTYNAMIATIKEDVNGLPQWSQALSVVNFEAVFVPSQVTKLDVDPAGGGLYVLVGSSLTRFDSADFGPSWIVYPNAVIASSLPHSPLKFDTNGGGNIALTDLAFGSGTRIFLTGRNHTGSDIPFLFGQLDKNNDFVAMIEEVSTQSTNGLGVPIIEFSFEFSWLENIGNTVANHEPSLDATIDTAYLWFDNELLSYDEIGDSQRLGKLTGSGGAGSQSGIGTSIAVDNDGNVYVSGLYADQLELPNLTLPLTPYPEFQFWVAKMNANGDWAWVQTTNRSTHWSGANNLNSIITLSPSGGALYLGGSVQGAVQFLEEDGTSNAIVSADLLSGGYSCPVGAALCPRRQAFVAQLGASDGAWITPKVWVLGEEIPRPGGNIKAEFPQITIDGLDDQVEINSYFSWDAVAQKLFAVGLPPTGLITINWQDVDSTPIRPVIAARTGIVMPPEDSAVQPYLFNAPVRLEPANLAGQPLLFEGVAWPSSAAVAATQNLTQGWVFNYGAATPGLSETDLSEYIVLRYTNAGQHVYQVVKAIDWQNTLIAGPSATHTVGTEIIATPGQHVDPSGANGFVVLANAPYDGFGPDRAYNRSNRQGQIFPVNTEGTDNPTSDRLMVVAWYQPNVMGVPWPHQTVEYTLSWPDATDAPRIMIADLKGTGPLDLSMMTSAPLLYHQDDRNQPGFNPNEEHALIAKVPSATPGAEPNTVLYAMRDDLNAEFYYLSQPYTLIKFRDAAGDWAFNVYRVCRDSESPLCAGDAFVAADLEPTYMLPNGPAKSEDPFVFIAGNRISPPSPLNILGPCGDSGIKPGGDPRKAGWTDVRGNLWARASNATDNQQYVSGETNGTDHTVFRFFYPLRSDFYHGDPADTNFLPTGECTPWLPDAANAPVDVVYEFAWPEAATIPVLNAGDSLYLPRLFSDELAFPTLKGQEAAQVIYDESSFNSVGTDPYNQTTPMLVRLLAPTLERKVSLQDFALSRLPADAQTFNRNGRDFFSNLPSILNGRLSYDPINNDLIFSGSITEPLVGDPQVLPNIMTAEERDLIKAKVSTVPAFFSAVDALYHKTRNPNDLSFGVDNQPDQGIYAVGLDLTPATDADIDPDTGEDTRLLDSQADPAEPTALYNVPMMLSSSLTAGEGYVTVALNNDQRATAPVELKIIKVSACDIYKGNIFVVPSDNVFEEALTLRHSGVFGGDPEQVQFSWYIQPDSAGQPEVPVGSPASAGWSLWQNNLNGKNDGLDITIEGANITTLSDNWVVANYRIRGVNDRLCNGAPVPPAESTSQWAGDPSSYDRDDLAVGKAMLALGWIKRVIAGLNPFDSRVSDFHDNEASTLASLIAQAGRPYNGPISFNPDGSAINLIGLIEAYETILNRGRDLSVNALDQQGQPAPINDVAANNQLLNVSTRIGDLYMLLANEAFADAADSTIGFDTSSELGTLASSIFTFQNQLDSPLEEELVLLRGRDDSRSGVGGYPLYNRLPWNFTQGTGEVAYVQAYNISDQNQDGFITEEDAAALYPLGHGDAWGHYLSSVKSRYQLLKENDFTWVPRTESVTLGGMTIEVDYRDERKFATAAAAKARTGAEIVNLTYRDKYVEDPAGQWQGYKDTAAQQDRAWGLDGWSRRAGQGAYFDWLAANAILPAVDPDQTNEGIAKIDRTTVIELAQIASQFGAIQGQVDKADAGLNPLGLAKGLIPFDIDPNFLENGNAQQGRTHFEQVAERAQKALNNAVTVFNHANQQTQALRNLQDNVDDLTTNVSGQERDLKNRLIEIFGYPFASDPDTPSGYDGPDLYKYNYVKSDLTGDLPPPNTSITGFFSPITFADQDVSFYYPGDLATATVTSETRLELNFPLATGATWQFIAPNNWGLRRAPGEIQIAISDFLQADAQLQRAVLAHDNLLTEIEDAADLVEAEFNLAGETLEILNTERDETLVLDAAIVAARTAKNLAEFTSGAMQNAAGAIVEGIPKSLGTSTDALAPVRAAVKAATNAVSIGFDLAARTSDVAELGFDLARRLREQNTQISLVADTTNVILLQRIKEVEQLLREEPSLRLALATQAEVVQQSLGRYYQLLAEGQRILQERRLFRVQIASRTQQHRYQDMTFRVFRNDALQKYRSTFDLAARYIYLAASAYDYETSLESGANGSGREFLADIVRQRTLGQVVNGVSVAGTPGLADVLARMQQNFDVYKGQLGFNNPQIETNRFSMRREWLKLRDENDLAWREKLADSRVSDLWQVPEFRRYARAFVAESSGPQPGIVLRFPSTVTFGKNFFDQNLGAGDSAYDSSNFATKIRSVGVWFDDYALSSLSNTPRIYLFPVLQDVMRTPSNDASLTREWSVVDQKLPVPFPVGPSNLSDINWVPSSDSLSDSFAEIRRFSSFRAYHDGGTFDESEASSDTRLIGRSVWNNGWVMIIPGGTLLFDADEGLDRFIYGQARIDAPAECSSESMAINPGPEVCRDGMGIDDILMFFQTYGYSGN
ncbi:MAG: hypothetical protein JKX81_04825 [Arenicella sp.]|nr:hypothetical protein [Arenicella sp.]